MKWLWPPTRSAHPGGGWNGVPGAPAGHLWSRPFLGGIGDWYQSQHAVDGSPVRSHAEPASHLLREAACKVGGHVGGKGGNYVERGFVAGANSAIDKALHNANSAIANSSYRGIGY